ncbi:type I polyketide synthase [Nocardia arthritidis]|uniref:Acyltransferase domain-containing protein n=1 Tax=Nocardia arthritidis TaxID=228602 RepID=A0A6G9YKA3_9NOCA|nr:type I polyketide synthase [Nocardia arthritidis]QIS13618.1 acyltransferase domain-containing protein [Nocardia arthritidis]
MTDSIAIIGMACRFPGAANLAAFWDLISSGRTGLQRFSDEELAAAGVPESLRGHRNYVPVGGVIEDQDRFDPDHFGLTPADAALFDPQLRLLLECAWNALGDAGHSGGGGLGAVGVFTGASHSQYLESNLAAYRRAAAHDPIGLLQAQTGALTDYFPQQLAYRLNLTGPAVAVQATCATSLVAVHMAAQSLLSGECDAALAGGVSLIVPQGRGYLHVPDSIFAADGRTRTFGADASGMVHSQGVGVVVLRRLTEALADGDPIYAVLRGSAVNHDGAGKAGFTAPSVNGQARVIAEALAAAGVGADDVGLIEAHGTATALGDQIELSALAAVFADRSEPEPIAIGSVKSNIGHANSAAGIAALIKTALALEHRRIPATLYADPVHPDLARYQGLFEVAGHTRDWPDRQRPRIAGVSSFGIGGTNCHVVLEEPIGSERGEPDDRAQLFVVSGKSEQSCRAQLEQLAPDSPADYAFTLAGGAHTDSGWRAAAVWTGRSGEPDRVALRQLPSPRPGIVFAFPGAGAQYSGMGAGLYRDEPVFAAMIDECANAVKPVLDYDIRDLVTGVAPRHEADDVRYGQPALFAVSLATAATLRGFGIEPDAVLGHSLGEYAAAVTAGMLGAADAARLVAVRSRAVARTAPGAMLAVALGETDLRDVLADHPKVAIAAINAADSCVVSGPAAAIDDLTLVLTGVGIHTNRLRIDAALHSPAVAAAVDALRDAAARAALSPARLPLYSTLTGAAIRFADAEHWVRQLCEPVQFRTAIRAAAGAEPTIVVQIGPGATLASLARRNAPAGLTAAFTTLPGADENSAGDSDRAALLTAVGQLWCAGADFDAEALHRKRRRVRLPDYPFQRRRLWIDPPVDDPVQTTTQTAPGQADPTEHPDRHSPVFAAETFSTTADSGPEPIGIATNALDADRNGTPLGATAGPQAHSAEAGAPQRGSLAVTEQHTAPSGTLTMGEQLVANLWTELLGLPVSTPDADFFALGGNSMLATRMLDLLNDREQADIRLRELLTHSTVAAFAELIARRAPTATSPNPVVVQEQSVHKVVGSEATFPLTRVQHAYWVGRSGAFGLSDVSCHIYLEYDCHDLDLARYQLAWNRLIDRHDMLRAVITDDGRNRVLDRVPEYRVRRHDLTDLPPAERESALADLRRQLSHRVHRPDRWPLFDIRAACIDDTTTRIFFGIDALICDAASFLVLDRDLHAYYDDPDAALPPIRTGFPDYLTHLSTHTGTAEHQRAVDYWRERMDTIPGPPALPTRIRTQSRPWFARRGGQLSPAEWDTLRSRCAEHGVTPSAVLLTAYADVLAAWSGDERFALMLTLVDRPVTLPGIESAIGDFTTLLAHEVERGGESFAERAARTQRRLFEDIDHRGWSALDLLAEKSTKTGERQLLPVVFTSALDVGELVGGTSDLEWAGRIVHGVSQTPQVWLDHQAFVQAGALQLQWDVLETVLDADAADTAFDAYVTWLRRLVDDAGSWDTSGDGPNLAGSGADVTETVTEIWTQVLGIESASVTGDSTFVGLGGDSVLAVRMATLVRGRLGVAVPVVDLVGDQTLAQLVAYVGERRSGGMVASIDLVRQDDPDAPFALTPLQQAYWVGQQHGWALSYDSAHMYVDFRLAGADSSAVADSVRWQVNRQPMLRAIFLPDGTQQVLRADDPRLARLPLTEIDMRTASIGEIERMRAEIRAEMQRTGPDMDPWPFRMAALLLPGGELSLHIVTGLLVADGWSVQLMFTELFTHLDDPNTVLPPLTAHFGDYVATIDRQRSDPEWLAQRDWWWDRLDELPTAPRLPFTMPVEQARPDDLERRELWVSGERMAVLRERCTAYGVTPTTVFATCYAIALARLAGHRRFLLNVLYLNRLHLPRDLDHAIGPYAGTVLLEVDLPADADFVTLARTMQDATARMLDHGQVTGVEIARELGRRRRDTAPQAPVVFHSTLGLHPPGGTPAAIQLRDFYQRVRTPQVALDMQVFQWDWDDAVVVNLDAVAELFAPGVLDDLFAAIGAELTALIDNPESWSAAVELPPRERADEERPAATEPPVSGPAATDTERAVAAVWARMLEIDATTVTRSTDFFTVGGDSVLAIRMLNRLRTELGLHVTPREFLADPTLAATAAARHEPGPADCAVTLRDGTGDPLFLIHPTGGDVLCYLDLARKLDTVRPVIGIQDPALSGATGPEGIGELARLYETVLRSYQPSGPYVLGGWSMGGIVAHEVARRLRDAGDAIAVLILIDANIADRIADTDDLAFWSRYLSSLEAFLQVDLETAAAAARFESLSEAQRRAETDRILTEAGLAGRGDTGILRLREDAFRRHLRALGGHRTGRLDGDELETLIVRAELPAPRNSGIGMGVDDCTDLPDLGWGAHTGGRLEIRSVPAHHYALLTEPAVDAVARLVSRALAGSEVGAGRMSERSERIMGAAERRSVMPEPSASEAQA